LIELTTLDIAYNKLTDVSGLASQRDTLEELWLNWNQIENFEATMAELQKFHKLKTVYIADNPMVKDKSSYLEAVKAKLPSVEQIDGYMLKQLFNFKGQVHSASIVKKDIDPKAK
jgi:protein phosphatase 1 regulatory subunit 7